MSGPRCVRVEDAAEQPWKNGGGRMRELLLWPPGEGWQARVGVADITRDGPFSHFPGVQRRFVVLDGAGVELTIAGPAGDLVHGCLRGAAPLHFDGGAATACRLLDGPCHVLNLLLHGGAVGGLEPAHHGQPWRPPTGACGLFSLAAGECGGQLVAARTLCWFDAAPAELVFEAAAAQDAQAGWWLWAAPPGAQAAR